MRFGNQDIFALEAVIESDSELPPICENNVVGRFHIFIAGQEIGNFEEPSCVFRPLCEHLIELCSKADTLWHESLAGLTPKEQFKLLNDYLFIDENLEPPEAYHFLTFLTNVSEVFDGVKGFLLAPPDSSFRALLCIGENTKLHCYDIPRSEFCSVSKQFESWVEKQELDIYQKTKPNGSINSDWLTAR